MSFVYIAQRKRFAQIQLKLRPQGRLATVSTSGKKLDLNDLSKGLPAITPNYGAGLAEAGAVCLEDQGHSHGVTLSVNGSFNEAFETHWSAVTEQMRRCWNDLEFTTEQGAYGVAFLIISAITDFTVIERSRKGTGFDYWLGHEEEDLPFSNKARLEVSGIRNGDNQTVRKRVKRKLNQTNISDGSLPALVVVVEFGTPLSQVKRK